MDDRGDKNDRGLSGKRQFELFLSSSDLDRHFGLDDFDNEDDLCALQCPHCSEELCDVASLCDHLEGEHPFEPKVVPCPICHVRQPRDLIGHLMLQHGPLFKERSRRRIVSGASSSSMGASSSSPGSWRRTNSSGGNVYTKEQKNIAALLGLTISGTSSSAHDDEDLPGMSFLSGKVLGPPPSAPFSALNSWLHTHLYVFLICLHGFLLRPTQLPLAS